MLSFRHLLQDKQIKQSLLLLSTSVMVMVLMLTINYFITRILGKSAFGDYSLILNIFNFSQIIFNFGFFHSISRMIAVTEDELNHRELYAVGLIVTLILFIIMSVCLFIYSLMFDKSNAQGVLNVVILFIPFGWIFLLNNFNELLLQGSNKIILLSFSRFMPRLIFLLILIIIYYFAISYRSITLILFCFLLSSIPPYTYVIFKLRPKFNNLKMRIKDIKEANHEFGFNVYLGSLFAVGASSLSGILISYFGVNNIEVGYYSIALQLSAPLSLIPNVLATTSFKKFANSRSIDRKLLLVMYLISAFTLIFIIILAKPIVLMIYGVDYMESVDLLYFLATGSVLYGIADFYNRFLLSKGRGNELRNASFLVGGILIISNIVFINLWGAKGAAIATIISGFSYLIIIIYYFKRVSKLVLH